jgi:hypothetical protein
MAEITGQKLEEDKRKVLEQKDHVLEEKKQWGNIMNGLSNQTLNLDFQIAASNENYNSNNIHHLLSFQNEQHKSQFQ